MASNISIDMSSLGISWDLGESYRVAIDQNFVNETGGLRLPMSGNPNLLTFNTPDDPPLIESVYPVNNETASNENLIINLKLDRNALTAISGNVDLYKIGSPNTLIKSYTISDTVDLTSNIAGISGGNIKLPINYLLEANENYYVTTDANIVQDSDGFKFAGISSSNVWTWGTSTNWYADLSFPQPDTYNEDTITAIESCLIVKDIFGVIGPQTGTYTMNVTSNISSSVKSLSADGSGGSSSWADPTLTVSGTIDEVNNRLGNLTLTPEDDYTGNIVLDYELTDPASNVSTRSQTITNAATNAETLNLAISRGYYLNDVSYIFEENPILIDDSGVSESDNYSVYITMGNVSHGGFGYPGYNDYGNIGFTSEANLTITGSKTTVNNVLEQIRFFPTVDFQSDTTFSYTQIRNGITQTTGNVALNYLGENTPTWANVSYTFDTVGTHDTELPFESLLYGKIDYVLVGGGGGGSRVSGISGPYGLTGHGKTPMVIERTNFIPTANALVNGNTVRITVGSGGNVQSNGGSTSGFGNTANGGEYQTTTVQTSSNPSYPSANGWWEVINSYIPASTAYYKSSVYPLLNDDTSSTYVGTGWSGYGTWYPSQSVSGGLGQYYLNDVKQTFDGEAIVPGESYWAGGYTSTLTGDVYGAVPLSFGNSGFGSSVLTVNATTANHPSVPVGKYGWQGQNGWKHNATEQDGLPGSQGFAYFKVTRK